MSTTGKPVDPGEWELQERGMRAARGREAGAMDAAALDYRIVAEALVSLPRSEPPADFAAGVAACAARREAGIERLLSRILLATFAVALVVACSCYGEQGWQALRQAFGDASLGWMLASLGCVALSWTCSRLVACIDVAGSSGRVA